MPMRWSTMIRLPVLPWRDAADGDGMAKQRAFRIIVALAVACSGPLATAALPPPASAGFCVAVQKILASTSIEGENTVFTDMRDYRKSKPMVDPLQIFQVVSYAGTMPAMVSCKVKTAAHLRAAYGEQAAGEQRFCPAVTRQVLAEAVAQLQAAGQDAAAERAAAFIVDDNEPYATGSSYLADFPLSYRADDGRVHLNSPGLFQDYDSWFTPLLPERFQGQSYCHLPTVDYLKALATGAMQPGTVMTGAEDAPVTPR